MPYNHLCGETPPAWCTQPACRCAVNGSSTGPLSHWNGRWNALRAAIAPWIDNGTISGVQIGDEFGDKFVEATQLAAGGPNWRAHMIAALVRQGLPRPWLPVVAEAAGAPADLAKLKKFVGRYRDVLQREGGKAVSQLVAQQPEASKIFDALRKAKTQRIEDL